MIKVEFRCHRFERLICAIQVLRYFIWRVLKGNHSGGTLDLTRHLKPEACRSAQLTRTLEAFWPRSTPTEEF